MDVIVLASQKGGSAKTTLAAHLSVASQEAWGLTTLIDTDPQQTLTKWWNRREADAPSLIEMPEMSLQDGLRKLPSEIVAVFVDTPPTITPQITRIIRSASLVLIPVRPSPADLWAVGETVAICAGERIPYAFVLTQATKGAGLTAQAIAALSEHGVVSQAIMYHRVLYAGAMASGSTAPEIEPRGPATQEIAGLLTFVRERLNASTAARKLPRTQAREHAR